jgi:hypothetical protein
MKGYIGIDPSAIGGTTGGAIVFIKGGVIVKSIKLNSSTETDIKNEITQVLEQHPNWLAAIEKVHSMPKQGVASSFKFGQGYGFLRGLLIGLAVPFIEVSPQKWQKFYSIPKTDSKTKHKNLLKQAAQQRFPKEKITLITADAILIANYLENTEGHKNDSNEQSNKGIINNKRELLGKLHKPQSSRRIKRNSP